MTLAEKKPNRISLVPEMCVCIYLVKAQGLYLLTDGILLK